MKKYRVITPDCVMRHYEDEYDCDLEYNSSDDFVCKGEVIELVFIKQKEL